MTVLREGRWAECDMLVDLWERSSGGTYIDCGANIGMCSLQILMNTSARVLAIEPNPVARFYLESSVRRLPESMRRRITVLPYAAGAAASTQPLFTQRGNLGNSVIGGPRRNHSNASDVPARWVTHSTGYASHAGEVEVRTLDSLVAGRGVRNIGLVKFDVEGFECKALEGGSAVMRHAQTVMAEADPGLLGLQGCSLKGLHGMLHGFGFNVTTARTRTEAVFVGRRGSNWRRRGSPFD